jgi:hypothetical protein
MTHPNHAEPVSKEPGSVFLLKPGHFSDLAFQA